MLSVFFYALTACVVVGWLAIAAIAWAIIKPIQRKLPTTTRRRRTMV